MFGLGFEAQSAVSDHAKNILLLQISDSFGLPVDVRSVVQIWITAEDLAQGRFDRVELTADAT